MQRLPCRFLLTGWRREKKKKKGSPQQICRGRHGVWRAQEAGNAVRHTPAQPQTLRIGDGGGRRTAAAEGKHSHTEPPQSRLLPTAGTLRSALCVHFSKGRCGFVTCRRYNPTHRNHKLAIERTIFMVTRSTNSTLLTIYDMCNLTRC